MFADKLTEKIMSTGNPTVAGLDPRIEYLPECIVKEAVGLYGKSLKACGYAIKTFNKQVIDTLCGIVPAIKPQFAYYELYGVEGMSALFETVSYAKEKGMLVIGDAKRNDIGSTAKAYSDAYLGRVDLFGELKPVMDIDALTVNPYLGIDGIKPFLEDCIKYGKGIFVLVKTSNPSSGQLQDLISEDERIYERMACLTAAWSEGLTGKYGYGPIGAVVGATYPEQAKRIRELIPNGYILVPGYGAQGGTAKDCLPSFKKDGTGAIINASRSLVFAYKTARWASSYNGENYLEIIREEAIRMKKEIQDAFAEQNAGE
ncbi:MAG: orotidine-5'-phosphate decarboxylase [Clostridia bacterium]|jgi:orotidine-5'-phosphate decarboxylase|nr:orotidine-5'-phosphate decarboxylase [Clostridiaceae bacterium]